MLPQLPGQLNDEPSAAARWLASTAAAYGVWGSALQALGLFNLLRSPLLAAFLALIVLIATIHLARAGARLRQFALLEERFTQPISTSGEPLALYPAEPVARRRAALPASPDGTVTAIQQHLVARFSVLRQETVPPAPSASEETAADASDMEHRFLALQHPNAVYLLPLLPLGMILIAAAIWWVTVFGWQVTTPALAPGESYRSVNHELTIHHVAPAITGTASIAEITLRGENRQVTRPEDSTRFTLGNTTVTLRRTLPALWIQNPEGVALLAQPDEPEPVATLGLVFPTPGSEESVLLPSEVAGLRLVRRTNQPDAFVVELYRSADVQPSLRAEVQMPDTLTIPLGDGGEIQVIPVRALQAEVRYLPGLWLAWLGIAAMLAGAVGALRRPRYLLIQVAPWPTDRSVLVAQASHAADLDTLVAALDHAELGRQTPAEQTPPAPSSAS